MVLYTIFHHNFPFNKNAQSLLFFHFFIFHQKFIEKNRGDQSKKFFPSWAPRKFFLGTSLAFIFFSRTETQGFSPGFPSTSNFPAYELIDEEVFASQQIPLVKSHLSSFSAIGMKSSVSKTSLEKSRDKKVSFS